MTWRHCISTCADQMHQDIIAALLLPVPLCGCHQHCTAAHHTLLHPATCRPGAHQAGHQRQPHDSRDRRRAGSMPQAAAQAAPPQPQRHLPHRRGHHHHLHRWAKPCNCHILLESTAPSTATYCPSTSDPLQHAIPGNLPLGQCTEVRNFI